MKKLKFALIATLLASSCSTSQVVSIDGLHQKFQNPPQSAKPLVWWHWLNGNISEEGIRKDILWMNRVGIGGFHVFDAGMDTPQVVEDRLGYMTEPWKHAFASAVSLADSLGMDVAIASSPGWSSTGGPWVTPADAMKKLSWRTMLLEGGTHYNGKLPAPMAESSRFQDVPLPYEHNHHQEGPIEERFYEDIAVFAVQMPDSFRTLEDLGARMNASADGLMIQYEFPQAESFRAVTLVNAKARTGGHAIPASCKDSLQISNDGVHFKTLCGVTRGAAQQQTEAIPYAEARFWRLKRGDASYVNSDFVLHKHLPINHFQEKAGFAYTCDLALYPTPADAEPCKVVDITSFCDGDELSWDVPKGRWMIYRFGCSLTGKKNHPASPEATGLEVDKLDKDAFARYLGFYLDSYKEAAGGLLGHRGVRHLMIDSYEAGAENWTAILPFEFKLRRGYDMMPWLPAMAGVVIGNVEKTETFLWDLRRTIGELFAENYDNASRIVREEYGMEGIFIESHEHGRSNPGDGISIKKSAAVPMAAMWMEGAAGVNRTAEGKADIRESASVAHIYGQRVVAAESLTISGKDGHAYIYYPGNLKKAADMEMAAGVNRFVIHESAHQPVDDKIPGVGLGPYGQWFNRNETWAELAGPWIQYLTRSCAMLQHGRYVADWVYYYGEDTNITAQFSRKELEAPFGFGYDFIGKEALLNELEAHGGKLVTPTGMEYSTLYVGGEGLRMSNEVRARIDSFKKSGVRVLEGTSLKYINSGLDPDIVVSDERDLSFVHRTSPEAEIYWLSSLMDSHREVEVSFRITGRKPRLWHPETGTVKDLSYRFKDGRTIIALNFEPQEAYFVVFEEATSVATCTVPSRVLVSSETLTDPWTVAFQEGRGAPTTSVIYDKLESLTESSVDGIKYFSGTATYKTSFEFSKGNGSYVLDLGQVGNIACVSLNGKDLGQVWKAPYAVDITDALENGSNNLEVRVTNLWVNRLIGDAQPGRRNKITWTSFDFYNQNDPLLPSGLMGPVSIKTHMFGCRRPLQDSLSGS